MRNKTRKLLILLPIISTALTLLFILQPGIGSDLLTLMFYGEVPGTAFVIPANGTLALYGAGLLVLSYAISHRLIFAASRAVRRFARVWLATLKSHKRREMRSNELS